ncbi:LacI family DNA-binding transcriptional regulator [Microbacterium hibisci]|uniref:LacI family DNA-binding transcriptional regulator n=1 Tax=Microbacterium hibisci TaxID=2036000 RepID=UPI0027DA6BA5|nr:LacI family DNA-binding transcriptional regulator [Microbacterium hibisci]
MTDTAPHRRPTIMEVARLADVSHQTVSRYFRAPDGLKPATKARVQAAVEQLHYRPNLTARSMRTRQTGRLAVVVPTLAYSPARMLAGASSAAHEAGFAVEVLALEGGAAERTARVAELADSRQVDGIVSFAPVLASLDLEATSGTPIIASADFDDEMRGIGELADASALVEVIEGLADLGHRRFLHVTGDLQFASARARRDTFVETLARLGLDPSGVVEGDWSAEAGMAAVRALADRERPTAVVAANDLVAAGVIRAALDDGIRVPGDLSVSGWDDQPLGRLLSPALTTVEIDLEGLGSRAMTRLICALRDEPAPAEGQPLHRVIWRESTGPAPR